MTTETEEVQASSAEAEAAFGAGFNEDTGVEPAVVAKPEPAREETPKAEPDAPAQAAAAEPEAFDPKKAFEQLSSQLGSLKGIDERLKRTEGRVGALQSALDTAKNVSRTGGAAPSQAQVQQAAVTTERWVKLKEDFPDWAEAMEERFAALPKSGTVDVEKLKQEVSETVGTRIQESARLAREFAKLDRKHEDWETTVGTPEFKAWALEGGPSEAVYEQFRSLQKTDSRKAEEMQDGFTRSYPKWWEERGRAMFSDSANDAVKLLDGYAEHVKSKSAPAVDPQKKTERLAAAVTPKGLPQAGKTTESVEAAFAAGFNGSG